MRATFLIKESLSRTVHAHGRSARRRSSLTLDGGRTLVYEAVVPANSEATLHLPAASADAAREGGAPLARVDGVRFLGHREGVSSYRLPSGRYRLTAELR